MLLSFSNEFFLFFSPFFCPILTLYASAKHFIFKFFLLKLQKNEIGKEEQIINRIFLENECLRRMNDALADEYEFNENGKTMRIIQNIRSMKKHSGFAAFLMFILQTFVLIYCNNFLNEFRLIQYFLSATSSLLVLLQTVLWKLKS